MKKIKLTQNKVALVDDEDYEFLNRWKWCVAKNRRIYYAKRTTLYSDGKRRMLYMHRLILGSRVGEEVDHKDGNGLNNQRSNLRLCTHSQNLANRAYNNKSGYRGVRKHGNKWEAKIGSNTLLDSYDTPEEAAIAFNKAAIEKYGEFARLNKEV